MPKVAIVKFMTDVQKGFEDALRLIGGINELDTTYGSVVIKPGIFDTNSDYSHASTGVIRAIADAFDRASQVYVVESDNTRGQGLERLQIYAEIFSNRVMPFNLSASRETRKVRICGESLDFCEILFKPNIFVSAHALRRWEEGTILKNLLGLIPDVKKSRFHGECRPSRRLATALLDAYEAIGGIDLAVLDGTYVYPSYIRPESNELRRYDILLVGRDAIAVEMIGATLVGLDAEEMPVIREAKERGLGGDIEEIEIVGESLELLKERIADDLT